MTDAQISQLIPHRSPMLLLSRLRKVSHNAAQALVDINADSSFFTIGKGVPSWIGVEYMGQTAALIAGYQLQQGIVESHVGLLLGTRKYQANTPWFAEGCSLIVSCTEAAVVGQSLATFQCEIHDHETHALYATAKLSVFRRPLDIEQKV